MFHAAYTEFEVLPLGDTLWYLDSYNFSEKGSLPCMEVTQF